MGFDEKKELILKYIKMYEIDMNIIITEEMITQVISYMDYILEKNNYINLTAIKDENMFIKKHIIDSLYVVKYIKKYNIKYSNILDIGTGGGFPLIVLKIFLNIENKKTYGMDKTLKKLKVITEKEDIRIIHSRAEIVAHDEKYREEFELVVSRAVSSIENVIEYSAGFVKIGEHAILMRGKKEEYDKKILSRFGFEEIIHESYKIFDEDRSIIILKKIKKLDAKLPNKTPKQKS